MFDFFNISYKTIGKIIIVLIILSSIFSIFMIFSASSAFALEKFHDSFFFLKKHIVWLIISYIFLILGFSIDLKLLQQNSIFIMFFTILLLIFVLIFGHYVSGAKRWIRFFGLGFQPSELAKVSFIIYLADWLDRKHEIMNDNFIKLFINISLLFLGLFLIYIEPDFGTIILLSLVIFIMFFVSNINKKYIFIFLFLGIIGFLYGIIFTSYRLNRFIAFLDPFKHFKDSGYQIVQSYLAIANSGIFGKGVGGSSLKLLYLPEAHTDFIFSIIIEEWGILGTSFIILFFLSFIIVISKIIFNVKDFFMKILVFGIMLIISLQAIINISVVTGFLPTKGIPLPFFSFGGSSFVMTFFSVGLILNVYKINRENYD